MLGPLGRSRQALAPDGSNQTRTPGTCSRPKAYARKALGHSVNTHHHCHGKKKERRNGDRLKLKLNRPAKRIKPIMAPASRKEF
jgi:hypothetical protein